MDEPEKKRPNAEYPLQNTNQDSGELVFHYSRERRLANAPKSVQDLYKEPGKKGFGLFRSLTATKPLATLFISIVVLCVMIFAIDKLGLLADSLGGNKITVSAIKYEGETFLVLTKTYAARKDGKEPYTGLVDIAVSPVVKNPEEDFPVFNHRIFFSLAAEEEYRFSVPFTSEELILVLQGETGSTNFKVKPK
jgi:hypothetical protein